MIVPANHPLVTDRVIPECSVMQIQAAVYCPHCEQALKVPLAAAGKKARCRCCQGRFSIPAPSCLIDDTMAFLMNQQPAQRFGAA